MILDKASKSSEAGALRSISGLTVAEIARAFLVSESAMEQHITRSKRNLDGKAQGKKEMDKFTLLLKQR